MSKTLGAAPQPRARDSNNKTNNLFAFFIERAIAMAGYVALIVPKALLNAPEYSITREILSKLKLTKLIDYNEKAFDVKIENRLPTYKEKDAIYTYHFYRLLQRARNIHLIYNTEPDVLNGGEPSRFLAQLQFEGLHNLTYHVVVPKISMQNLKLQEVIKTPQIIEQLKSIAVDIHALSGILKTFLSDPSSQ